MYIFVASNKHQNFQYYPRQRRFPMIVIHDWGLPKPWFTVGPHDLLICFNDRNPTNLHSPMLRCLGTTHVMNEENQHLPF